MDSNFASTPGGSSLHHDEWMSGTAEFGSAPSVKIQAEIEILTIWLLVGTPQKS